MTPQSHSPISTFPRWRAWGLLLLAAGCGAAAVGLSGLATGWPEDLGPALASLGVCLIAALVALEPVILASRQGMQRVTMTALVMFPLRVAIVGAGTVALMKGLQWPVVPLALWTLLWYLVLLCVEIGLTVQYLNTAASTHAPLIASHRLGSPS